MVTCTQSIRTFDDLREYVNQTICDHYGLQVDAFRLTERPLYRGGRSCGICFCLHGPRAVKFIAIWETERNRVLFYGSNGERFHNAQLATTPIASAQTYRLTASAA